MQRRSPTYTANLLRNLFEAIVLVTFIPPINNANQRPTCYRKTANKAHLVTENQAPSDFDDVDFDALETTAVQRSAL